MNGILGGRTAVVIGGSGALGSAIALGLADAGARLFVAGRSISTIEEVRNLIHARGGAAIAIRIDALDRESLQDARSTILGTHQGIDILVNATGGNSAAATLPPNGSGADLDVEAFRDVVDANLVGVLLPIQVFVRDMIAGGRGSIINISSMAAGRPLTRVAGYGAAKAALENFTRWTAVNLAQLHGDTIRVNAIAPGFILAEQNRDLLLTSKGQLTERGRAIVDHTPMGRLGTPEDVAGVACWLASDASRFVTGTVIPVDGGFSAYAGV